VSTLVILVLIVALLLALPGAVVTMKRWLRNTRSGGFVGSVGAGLAAAHDPAAAMILAENERQAAVKGDEDKEGADKRGSLTPRAPSAPAGGPRGR
jgi:hypothetical protein